MCGMVPNVHACCSVLQRLSSSSRHFTAGVLWANECLVMPDKYVAALDITSNRATYVRINSYVRPDLRSLCNALQAGKRTIMK